MLSKLNYHFIAAVFINVALWAAIIWRFKQM